MALHLHHCGKLTAPIRARANCFTKSFFDELRQVVQFVSKEVVNKCETVRYFTFAVSVCSYTKHGRSIPLLIAEVKVGKDESNIPLTFLTITLQYVIL